MLTHDYTSFWLTQSRIFIGLVVALIASNLTVAASVFCLIQSLRSR